MSIFPSEAKSLYGARIIYIGGKRVKIMKKHYKSLRTVIDEPEIIEYIENLTYQTDMSESEIVREAIHLWYDSQIKKNRTQATELELK